jgi:hypothetical protein
MEDVFLGGKFSLVSLEVVTLFACLKIRQHFRDRSEGPFKPENMNS